MNLRERFKGFLLLQNMMLRDFVRQGLANRSLATEEAVRLNRVEALNLQEIERWDKDLSTCHNSARPSQEPEG